MSNVIGQNIAIVTCWWLRSRSVFYTVQKCGQMHWVRRCIKSVCPRYEVKGTRVVSACHTVFEAAVLVWLLRSFPSIPCQSKKSYIPQERQSWEEYSELTGEIPNNIIGTMICKDAWNRVSHYMKDIQWSKKVEMDCLARSQTDPGVSPLAKRKRHIVWSSVINDPRLVQSRMRCFSRLFRHGSLTLRVTCA